MADTSAKSHEVSHAEGVFTLFPKLPPLVRRFVWLQPLPNHLRTAPTFLFSYNKGCWRCERLFESNEDGDDENRRFTYSHDFRTELLSKARFNINFASVNREAREVAQAWVDQQSIAPEAPWELMGSSILHTFDVNHDALYVPLIQWDDFLEEAHDGMVSLNPRWWGINHHPSSKVKYFAVTEDFLLCEFDGIRLLGDILFYFKKLEALLVVSGPVDYSGEVNHHDITGSVKLRHVDGAIKPILEHMRKAFNCIWMPVIEVWSVVAQDNIRAT